MPLIHTQLADFGLSGLCEDDGMLVSSPGGTPSFMAPEQFGDEPVGPDADVWAVGCMLWTALERRDLWEDLAGDEFDERRAAGAVPEPLSVAAVARCGMAGPMLQALLEGCLQVDPSKRWSILHVVIQLRAIVTILEK